MTRIENNLLSYVRNRNAKGEGYKLGKGYNKSYTNAVEKFLDSGKLVKKSNGLWATTGVRAAGTKLEVKQPAGKPATGKKRGRPRKNAVAEAAATPAPTVTPEPTPAPAVEAAPATGEVAQS